MLNEIDMKELLEETFAGDPIRREIRINNLESFLYTDSILNMHPETTYSTVEAGAIIGRKDSTLRNYFRTELIDYITPEKFGKYYRLNYESVFKFHMILLLVEKANKSTADLSYQLGYTPLVSAGTGRRGEKKSTQVSTNHQNEELIQIKKMMVIQTLKSNLSDEKSQLFSLKLDSNNKENKINSLERKIDQLEMKKENERLERKYYRMVDQTLKNTFARKKEEPKGLFKRIFSSSNDNEKVDIDEILRNAKETAEKDISKIESDQVIEKLKNELREVKEQHEKLLSEIEEKEEQIQQQENKLVRLQSNPDQIDSVNITEFLLGTNGG